MSLWNRIRDRHGLGLFRHTLFVVYISILFPLWGPPAIWFYLRPESDGAGKALGLAVIVCLPLSWWCAYFAGHYMAIELEPFRVATARALAPLVLRLSFLPLLGRWIARLAVRKAQRAGSGESQRAKEE